MGFGISNSQTHLKLCRHFAHTILVEIVDVFVRHSTNCSHLSDRYWKRCRCRKWLYLEGTRKPISAKTRSWEEAQRKARQIEAEHAGPRPASADAETPHRSSTVSTVREAVIHFLENEAQKNVSKNWLQKYKRELPHFAAWCQSKVRYVELASLDLLGLEDYRKTWTGAATTRRKRQERLRSFLGYCLRHKWIERNVVADLEPIKTKTPPKLPLTRAEFDGVMAAVDRYHPRGRDAEWRRFRARTMLLLLRWSGLRISDAARLERIAVNESGALRLYMQKTGEPVEHPRRALVRARASSPHSVGEPRRGEKRKRCWMGPKEVSPVSDRTEYGICVPLPPDVATMLRELPNPENPRYFFWNGTSDVASPGRRWWSTLKTIFKAAGLPNADRNRKPGFSAAATYG